MSDGIHRPMRLFAGLLILGMSFVCSAARAEPILISVIGDSNVAAQGLHASEGYPARLEQALRARGLDVRVINNGINGDTVAGVASRLDSAAPPGTSVAILWVGVNDVRRGADPASIRAQVNGLANRLRARGIGTLVLGGWLFRDLYNDPKYKIGDVMRHLNGAGYQAVVARTLPQVLALIGRRRSS